MKYISDKTINVVKSFDVIVVGGGIAGVSAALSAARNGAKTLLVEKQCILGGLATSGLVVVYLPLCNCEGKQISFGVAEELLRLSVKHQHEPIYPKAWLEGGSAEEKKAERFQAKFNPQLFSLEMEKLLTSNGVKILFDSVLCNVIVENERITKLILENKSGRVAYEAKCIVDATGDADVCHLSNAGTDCYEKGNILAAWNNVFMDGQFRLNMLGVSERSDDEKRDNEEKPLSEMRFFGINAEENSIMLQMAHEHILKSYEKNSKEHDCYSLVTIPTMPQLRMTRRLIGAYTLDTSEEDKVFTDSIGLISNWKKRGPIYEIPFGTLYSNKIKNLICAGRCISVTDSMWDITRVIPACAVTGQAAGTAAALTDDFAKTDMSELQRKLRKSGVVIHKGDL